MISVDVTTTKSGLVTVTDYSIKRSEQFSCVGWISQPLIPDSDPLIILAVSDIAGNVLSDAAIKFEIVKEDADYRLRFSNSLSKKIYKAISVDFNDTMWHFLSYACTGEGNMLFYVDGIPLSAEDGVGTDGMPYSIAWSRSVRQGGGDVWAPRLYKIGQAVSVFNWRFGAGFQLHQQWLQELMARDRVLLEAE